MSGDGGDDGDSDAFEASERRRRRGIYRWAAVFWVVIAIVMTLFSELHPAFTWCALVALAIAAMYASGRSFTNLVGRP